ncbi:hypothetical protein BS78_03G302000 [Paspalum vaginatum]|nr:hypothetical protein BS78_03G302000 [Paspalum vaginatum]
MVECTGIYMSALHAIVDISVTWTRVSENFLPRRRVSASRLASDTRRRVFDAASCVEAEESHRRREGGARAEAWRSSGKEELRRGGGARIRPAWRRGDAVARIWPAREHRPAPPPGPGAEAAQMGERGADETRRGGEVAGGGGGGAWQRTWLGRWWRKGEEGGGGRAEGDGVRREGRRRGKERLCWACLWPF